VFYFQAFFENRDAQSVAAIRKGTELAVVCKIDGVFGNVIGKNYYLYRFGTQR